MPRELQTELGGWGAVRNPLDDEEMLEVDDGVVTVDDEETARALDAEYDRLTLVDDEGEDENEDEGEGGEEEDEFDAEAFVDRTPMDDVIDDIEAGEADDHLDAVADAAEREGVKDAIDERRE